MAMWCVPRPSTLLSLLYRPRAKSLYNDIIFPPYSPSCHSSAHPPKPQETRSLMHCCLNTRITPRHHRHPISTSSFKFWWSLLQASLLNRRMRSHDGGASGCRSSIDGLCQRWKTRRYSTVESIVDGRVGHWRLDRARSDSIVGSIIGSIVGLVDLVGLLFVSGLARGHVVGRCSICKAYYPWLDRWEPPILLPSSCFLSENRRSRFSFLSIYISITYVCT